MKEGERERGEFSETCPTNLSSRALSSDNVYDKWVDVSGLKANVCKCKMLVYCGEQSMTKKMAIVWEKIFECSINVSDMCCELFI